MAAVAVTYFDLRHQFVHYYFRFPFSQLIFVLPCQSHSAGVISTVLSRIFVFLFFPLSVDLEDLIILSMHRPDRSKERGKEGERSKKKNLWEIYYPSIYYYTLRLQLFRTQPTVSSPRDEGKCVDTQTTPKILNPSSAAASQHLFLARSL